MGHSPDSRLSMCTYTCKSRCEDSVCTTCLVIEKRINDPDGEEGGGGRESWKRGFFFPDDDKRKEGSQGVDGLIMYR